MIVYDEAVGVGNRAVLVGMTVGLGALPAIMGMLMMLTMGMQVAVGHRLMMMFQGFRIVPGP